MTQPTCTVIAGPNGAHGANCRNFVNADLIAQGLSPLAAERELLAASRLFLLEIDQFVRRRENFAFETTLAGKGHLRLIRRLLADGWRVDLYYLWLPTVEMCMERVTERVAHGGHDVPRQAILRRYPRSLANLLTHYAPLCSSVVCVDNSTRDPKVIFAQNADGLSVKNRRLFEALRHGAEHD